MASVPNKNLSMTDESKTQETNIAEPVEAKPSPLPDVGDLLFIGVMYILLFGRPDFLFQDASIGWHLEAGKFIFENKAIPYTDLFSYTFPDKPWVAYEWLFDVLAYILNLVGGYNLLAVCISGLIAFILTKMYDQARANGGSLFIATTVSLVGIIASAVHWLARPHIFTFLGVLVFVTYLEHFERDKISKKKLITILALTMILWVNSHPAFLLGIALTGVYFGLNLLQLILHWGKEKATQLKAKTSNFFLALVCVSFATLLNPYGFGLHAYIFQYLGGSTVLKNTDEFLSPVFHGNIHALCLEILFAFLVVGLSVSKRKLSAPYLFIVITFIHLSLSAVRNIPLFTLIVVPAIGFLFAKTTIEERTRPLEQAWPFLSGLIEKFAKPFAEFDIQEKLSKMRILSICYFLTMVITALMGGSLFGIINLNSGFSPTQIPTKTLEYIKTNKLAYDKGFNFDNWGGIIRFKLDQRVFIDDRADFYGEKFYIQYGNIIQAKPGWEKLLDKNNIEWILMPSNTMLVQALKDKPGWQLKAKDEAASLYVRNNSRENDSENSSNNVESKNTKP